jgi:serine/threonine-protein kinase HipA
MSDSRDIFVSFAGAGDSVCPLGVLKVQETRGKEFFSFAFDEDFLLSRREFPPLDPELNFYSGAQYPSNGLFGLFLDTCPDRWGRRLMQRRAAELVRQGLRESARLRESDYLLGVCDETRMGALRFRLSPDGPFLNDDAAMAVPPLARLRELEEASRHLEEEDDPVRDDQWLSLLLAPGSSLGGARPKANVRDPDGSLWIAKFPSHNDQSNVSAWEYATMRMARDCGLQTPPCALKSFSRRGATFLVKRFDRKDGERIHFASAMTLLGRADGADAASGASYLELAQFMLQNSASPVEDLHELWRRIAFSIAVSNTDDHLRNHGFLLTQKGWRLSPVYDVNPNAQGSGLSLNISEDDNALDFALVMEVAPFFRLTRDQATEILHRIRQVGASFRTYADQAGIPRGDQEEMSGAFRACLATG